VVIWVILQEPTRFHDPRFKIQGGEPWNKTPLLPGKDTQQYEQQQFNIPLQPQLPAAGIGNVGGMMFAQAPTFYGDTINMGPSPGTYSNMPVIPDEVEEQIQREQMMEQFRNRALYPKQIPVALTLNILLELLVCN
jgi:hypothetical protein